MIDTLAWLYGRSAVSAQFKHVPEDFIVEEQLSFLPEGEGEHIFIYMEKIGYNTLYVADKLAQFTHISPRLVSYAGLKDRQAVTRQWFSLHIPGKLSPDFTQFSLDGCKILIVKRHRKKLGIGALKGNNFTLILRKISELQALISRIEKIKNGGVPNYFGQQRFGKDHHNVLQARRWANGEILVKDRKKRSFYLSAARSEIFNYLVSQRISQQLFNTILPGDIMQLNGSHSWFIANKAEIPLLQNRLLLRDIQITAALVGKDVLNSTLDALEFEQSCLLLFDDLIHLMRKENVENGRRSIQLYPQEISYHCVDDHMLQLSFWLPAGGFATSVLRELIITDESIEDINE